MQDRNYVDISFTVLDRVRQGRRLLLDLDTGQSYYDPPEPEPVAVEPEPEPVAVEPEPEPEKVTHVHKPKTKKLHHG